MTFVLVTLRIGGVPVPVGEVDGTPVLFLKPPTTTLVGCGPVRFPVQSSRFDWEIEPGVVLGRRMRRV